MIVEVVAAGSFVAALYEYVTNKKFKAAVNTEFDKVQAEVAALKTKATSSAAVTLVEADFAKVEAAAKSLVAKL